jgi:hypothetical protein
MEALIYAVGAGLFVVLLFWPARQSNAAADPLDYVDCDGH